MIMHGTLNHLINGAGKAATIINGRMASDSEALSIAVSCIGRKIVMKGQTDLELEEIMDILKSQVHQIGFYSYGELSPYPSKGCCFA